VIKPARGILAPCRAAAAHSPPRSAACWLTSSRWSGLAVTSRSQLPAENLFLRKQLALYQERRVKSRRPDPATRVVLALLSRLLDWRALLTVVQPHPHPVASSGLAAPLAADVATRTAAHSEGVAATHREHGPGEPDLG
jgi:hypothetical protein